MSVVLCLHFQQSSLTSTVIERNEFSNQCEGSGKRTTPLSSLCMLDESGMHYVFNFDVSGFSNLLPNSAVLSSPEEFLFVPDLSFDGATSEKKEERLPFYYLLTEIREQYEQYCKCTISHIVICCTPAFYVNSSLLVESVAMECGFKGVTVIDESSLLCFAAQSVHSRFLSFSVGMDTAYVSSTSLSHSSFVSSYKELDFLSIASLSQQLHNECFPTCSLSAIESALSPYSHKQVVTIQNSKGERCAIDQDAITASVASHRETILSRIQSLLSLHKWSISDIDAILVGDDVVGASLLSLLHSVYPSVPIITLVPERDLEVAFTRFGGALFPKKEEEESFSVKTENGKKSGYGEEFHFGRCVYRGFWKDDAYNGLGAKYNMEGDLEYRGMLKNGLYSGYGEMVLEKGDSVKGVFVAGELSDGCYTTYWKNGGKCYEGALKKGKRSGIGKEFDMAGNVVFDGCFLENARNGKGRLFHVDGSYIDGSFVDDQIDGDCCWYSAKGVLLRRMHYNRGSEEGECFQYNEEGFLVFEGGMLNGEYFGRGTLYYPTGGIHYDGEFLHGQFNGYGQLYDVEGNLTYIGEFHSGKRDGEGKEYDEHTKLVYVGSFKNDQRNGHGKFFFSEGHYYEGDFAENEMEGNGRMVWANGQLYEGAFHRGKKEGKGKYVWSDSSTYIGEYKDEKRCGQGTQFNAEGKKVYEGEWIDDVPLGTGTIFYDTGCYYTGDVNNLKREGQGTQFNSEGLIEYKGEWKHDLPNGFGIYYYGTNNYYEGGWVNGEKEGIGRMQYSNGNVYVGSFKNGVRCGKGCLLDSRGKIVKEVFESNKIQ